MNPVVTPARDDDNLVVFQLTDEDRKLLKKIRLRDGIGDDAEDLVMHKICVMQALDLLISPPEVRAKFSELKALHRKVEKLQAKWHAVRHNPPEELEDELEAAEKQLSDLTVDVTPTDHPICVSEKITDAAIHLNDSNITDRQRSALKGVIEDIMNTCPIVRITERRWDDSLVTVDRRYETAQYLAAEYLREELLKPIMDPAEEHGLPFARKLDLIRQAAALYRVEAITADTQTEAENAPQS